MTGEGAAVITLVSGLPRSGTSLCMQMLAAGGMPVLVDGARAADDSNPRGYFELEAVKRTRADPGWVASAVGRAVKVIHAHLDDLPQRAPDASPAGAGSVGAALAYRVIVMRRPLAEVVASQRAMLERQGKRGAALPDARLGAVLAKHLDQAVGRARARPGWRVLEVSYGGLVRAPLEGAAEIAAFLEREPPLDIHAMAAAVDPALWRHQGGA